MPKSRRKLALPVASLLILPLAGCSTPTTATSAASVAASIGHVAPSRRDTCETQRKLAAQSSRIDTIISGKETVYKPAPCKDQSPASPDPKTS